MNKIVRLAISPLEGIAGQTYPDTEAIRREVSLDGASGSEVEMSVHYARSDFFHDLTAMQGLRRAITSFRNQGE